MVCPCCGRKHQDLQRGCICGARSVAAPQTDEIVELPRLGRALTGLACAIAGLGSFLTPWLLAPALLGAYASVTAYKRARREPSRFGGLPFARAGVVLSSLVLPGLLLFGSYHAREWYIGQQESARAASRARMLELALAIQAYQKQYRALPSPQLDELRATGLANGLITDQWGKSLRYRPTGELAATNPLTAPLLTQYSIISAGEDGEFGTADDLVLRDGVFVSAGQTPGRSSSAVSR
ncbi:MAG: hypothetical protein SNJ67_11805 [Chloracidobacterium sp.]|uniref:Type II secretion system protein GspG C-terminal domain-containing protein n=1 Tax=Chloracidobacterium validum TaxID=2821543 RepID=A0ABX8BAY0_9BACT|nr:hypothetical protein [Chloracidobacterium validum]QUW02705.1 hypothetical protein J8C06_10230 [Chloracidobacterium validum]